MTLLLLRPVLVAAGGSLLVAGLACTSDPDPTGTAGTGGQAGSTGSPFNAAAFTDGIPIRETDACRKLEKAFEARINDDGCVLTVPLCPALIRVTANPADDCADYDSGALAGCLAFLDNLTCGELKAASCGQLPVIAGTGTGDNSCLTPVGGGQGGQAGQGGGGGAGGAAAGSSAVGGSSGSSGQP